MKRVLELQELEKLSGPIGVSLTNDYLFRGLLQLDNMVLKSMACALLHLREDEVASIEVTNPIVLGEALDEKEFNVKNHIDMMIFHTAICVAGATK